MWFLHLLNGGRLLSKVSMTLNASVNNNLIFLFNCPTSCKKKTKTHPNAKTSDCLEKGSLSSSVSEESCWMSSGARWQSQPFGIRSLSSLLLQKHISASFCRAIAEVCVGLLCTAGMKFKDLLWWLNKEHSDVTEMLHNSTNVYNSEVVCSSHQSHTV